MTGASRRAEAGLFLRGEHQRSAHRRPRDVQRDAAADRHLFQQDPVFLLHRGAARPASESRHAGGVLRRSGLRQRSRSAQHRYDHARLYVLPLGQSRQRQRICRASFPARRRMPPTAKTLFSERCTACHALDANKYGPMLGGVVGRQAGAVPAIAIRRRSRARASTWSVETLDRWLTDPQAIRSRRENAGSRSRDDVAPRHHRLSAAGRRRPKQKDSVRWIGILGRRSPVRRSNARRSARRPS